jgi:hypothetical protein
MRRRHPIIDVLKSSGSMEGFIVERTIFFAHGKESGPWGTKFQALAEVAKGKGYRVENPDYSDLMDPDKRVERLERRDHSVAPDLPLCPNQPRPTPSCGKRPPSRGPDSLPDHNVRKVAGRNFPVRYPLPLACQRAREIQATMKRFTTKTAILTGVTETVSS